MKPTILVSGATGSTGNVAVQLLLEEGFPVRALVHKHDERSEKLKAQGAEIVLGDFLNFRSIQPAFDGVQRAYFCYPVFPGVVQATVHFAQAALDAKLEHVVNISQRTSREDAISESAIEHWLAEQVFDRSGVPVTHLRPTAFNEWLLYTRGKIGEGEYGVPFGPNGKFAPVSARDQGRVIATILADPASHIGKTYSLHGPVELTPPQIAEIVSQTLGKEVRYRQITPAEWIQVVFGGEFPFGVQHLNGIIQQHERGDMAGTNNNIENITGHKPESVAEFVERYRQAFA
ncbi:NmrA family NAD(P)-binding protein [Burkholderia sp. L27(2015)]|uniref:NmrA family NAD(P)-binding protein n=1 Tax=Burkholderia sp. L27(2015) TaxID=1641858 RepID=UPI00131B35B5|nr:NmrA family NAD(P)-binding protein [Burkholderia sp. L27(2015)]